MGVTQTIGTFKKFDDAVKAVADRKAEVNSGTYLPEPNGDGLTFGEYFDDWIVKHRLKIKPKTMQGYVRNKTTYFDRPIQVGQSQIIFSALPLAKITPGLVADWTAGVAFDIQRRSNLETLRAEKAARITDTKAARLWLKCQGYPVPNSGNIRKDLLAIWQDAGSPRPQVELDESAAAIGAAYKYDGKSSAHNAYRTMRKCLSTAAKEGKLSFNPASGAEVAKADTKEREPATRQQINALVAQMPPEFSLTVLLGAWGFMRRGEVLGLQRGDVTLKYDDAGEVVGASICVRHNNVPGVPIGSPKTQASDHRYVPVPQSVAQALELHLIAYAAPGVDGWLFPNEDGNRMDANNFSSRCWSKARKAVTDLPRGFRFHDLRHNGATEARRAGATLPELMRLLGHKDLKAVMIYQHVDNNDLDAIANHLEQRLMKKVD